MAGETYDEADEGPRSLRERGLKIYLGVHAFDLLGGVAYGLFTDGMPPSSITRPLNLLICTPIVGTHIGIFYLGCVIGKSIRGNSIG